MANSRILSVRVGDEVNGIIEQARLGGKPLDLRGFLEAAVLRTVRVEAGKSVSDFENERRGLLDKVKVLEEKAQLMSEAELVEVAQQQDAVARKRIIQGYTALSCDPQFHQLATDLYVEFRGRFKYSARKLSVLEKYNEQALFLYPKLRARIAEQLKREEAAGKEAGK